MKNIFFTLLVMLTAFSAKAALLENKTPGRTIQLKITAIDKLENLAAAHGSYKIYGDNNQIIGAIQPCDADSTPTIGAEDLCLQVGNNKRVVRFRSDLQLSYLADLITEHAEKTAPATIRIHTNDNQVSLVELK